MSSVGTLPNFLIIGAMRSGTTSLARYLGANERVYMVPEKEIHYFDRHFALGIDWYKKRFVPGEKQTAIGEATANYLYDSEALTRIASVLPKVKLIVSLRDPIDRAYSHYWMNHEHGSEHNDFRTALALEEERIEKGGDAARTFSYLSRGRYLGQIETVRCLFPPESLKVVIFEQLRDDPFQTYGDVCRFLRVDGESVPEVVGSPLNRFREIRSPSIRRRTRGLPRGIRNLFGRLNSRDSGYPPMDPEVRSELAEVFREDNAELERVLGIDLSVWDRQP
jgi:hypothetical protein